MRDGFLEAGDVLVNGRNRYVVLALGREFVFVLRDGQRLRRMFFSMDGGSPFVGTAVYRNWAENGWRLLGERDVV